MSATRASGTNAVRYGTMRENVLALEVVTASGEVIRTGTRAKKSSAGYDLTRLFVGSEGTLGVITEVTVRIYPLPEAISAAICSFPTIDAAVQTTIQTIQLGVPIARVELIDANTVKMVNAYAKLGLREEHLLLMEFHGSPASVKEQAETVQDIASEHGAQAFEWATTPEERTRLWTARHNAYFAAIQSKPGCRAISTDTCVPISRLADCLLDSVAEADASGLPYFLVGHVGDGNFHFRLPDRPRQARGTRNRRGAEPQAGHARAAAGRHLHRRTRRGLHKMDFLLSEAGAGAVDMMRTIKRALDPKNIMNPGKIFSL
jgi:D-lactate dehydrogenase (cytochrome)